MHDLTLIAPLCNQIEEIAREHNAQKIVHVVLEVGEEFGHEINHFQETFLLFAGTNPMFHQTKIEFRKDPGIIGDHLIIRDVEMEVPEAAGDVSI
jgi:Zn finger protein HypA/HybF involved in hydrogenase expression